MPIEYSKPEIDESDNKPVALPNKGFPYPSINDRRFEELLYSIGKQRIDNGDWKGKYDDINLLQGVRERGRDCSLHLYGKSVGLIQCKHSIDSNNRISKPECAREIIKFVLHYLVDNKLIHDPKNFTYYFSVSYGFTEDAKDLLDDFNSEISKQPEVQEWTEKVINANEELKYLKYSNIEFNLKKVLKSITVKKIVPQDLDKLLNSDGFQPIVKTFFEIKMVVESDSVVKLAEEIKKQGEYQTTANIPINTILEKFDHASHHLRDYRNTFDAVDDSHIDRKETENILQWIKSPLGNKEQPVILLVGGAGSGKTVILKDVFLKLREDNIPAIGLKADRYYAESITDLQNKIDLEASFEKVVRTLSQVSERVVVLIDQLDALSQSLSAKREYLDAYTLLVRKLIAIDRVRVVISVRTYDLNYDNELRFYKNQKSINVDLLDTGQVVQVLVKLGIRQTDVPKGLLQLLQTPHHLNVFCKIYNAHTNLKSIQTLHDLYDSLWFQRVMKIPNISSANAEKCQKLVFTIAERMYEEQRISTSSQPFLESFANELEYLKSCGIINEADKEIQFFHQTFFDYSFAKQFVQNENPVATYILENHQGLFIRSSLKMVIGFLREQNHPTYIQTLETILLSSKYRFHIKLMLLNLLGFEEVPTKQEKDLVKCKVLKNKKLKRLFIESVNSSGWLDYLIDLGELEKLIDFKNWLNQILNGDGKKARKINTPVREWLKFKSFEAQREEQLNLCFQLLIRNLPQKRKSICKFLLNCSQFEGKHRFIFRLLYSVKEWDIPEAFQLFEKYEDEARQDRFGYYKILEDALKFNIDWVIQKYKLHCLEKIEAVKSTNDKPQFEHQDEELLKKLFEVDVEKAFNLALDVVKRISDKTSSEDKSELYIDLGFWLFDYERHSHSQGYEAIYHLLIDKIQEQAKNTTPLFNKFIATYKESNSITILRLVVYGLIANCAPYVNQIFELIQIFNKKKGFEGHDKIQFQFRQLLKNAYPYFTLNQKDEIDKIILSIKSKYELGTYVDDQGKKRHTLRSYGKDLFLYLNSIPANEMKDRPYLKKRFMELQRKFHFIRDEEPHKISWFGVGPPMDSKAYEKMTYEHWESTFEKYDDEYKREFTSYRGSLLEHSRKFQEEVKNRSDYFFPFIEKLIDEKKVPYQYIVAGLTGLQEAKYTASEVQRIYKKALSISFNREYTLYFVWITSYFIETKILDKEVLEYLINLAKTHPDPESTDIRNNPLTDGANNVRGAAAGRISQVFFNPSFETVVFDALFHISEDRNISVRISILPRLAILMHLNKEKTLKVFLKLVNTNNPEILENSIWSVQYLANYNFDQLKNYFRQAIRIESLQGNIAVVLGVAWLKDIKGSYSLFRSVLRLSNEAKAKAVDMAIKNLADREEKVRKKCEMLFLKFLNSKNEKVIQEYSHGFLDFTIEMFPELYPLLKKYSKSNVATKQPHYYFEYLLKCSKKFPRECLSLLKHVNTYDKPDISQAGFYDDEPVKVLIGVYNSLSSLRTKDYKILNEAIQRFDEMLKSPKFRNSANKVIDMVES